MCLSPLRLSSFQHQQTRQHRQQCHHLSKRRRSRSHSAINNPCQKAKLDLFFQSAAEISRYPSPPSLPQPPHPCSAHPAASTNSLHPSRAAPPFTTLLTRLRRLTARAFEPATSDLVPKTTTNERSKAEQRIGYVSVVWRDIRRRRTILIIKIK